MPTPSNGVESNSQNVQQIIYNVREREMNEIHWTKVPDIW